MFDESVTLSVAEYWLLGYLTMKILLDCGVPSFKPTLYVVAVGLPMISAPGGIFKVA